MTRSSGRPPEGTRTADAREPPAREDSFPRTSAAGAGAFGGALRLLQNGFVRSYALSLLAGAALVLLALLVVNL